MNPSMIASLRTLLSHPDRPDRDALFAVLDNGHAAAALACLASSGSLPQIAAAMEMQWSWDGDGWDRHTDELVRIITDPRCFSYEQMIRTWSRIPCVVGVLRDRTAALVAWAKQRIAPAWYANLAILPGPSDAAARLLMRSPFSDDIGRTLRRWSMFTDPDAPTAWQAMIDPDLHAALHSRAPSRAFPAWRWDSAVSSGGVLEGIVDDLFDGWSPDHPSIRGRIAWLERHVDADLDDVGHLAILASIAGSDALAETVCARVFQNQNNQDIRDIVHDVPWSRLHPHIRNVIIASGQAPLGRIDPERWSGIDGRIVRFWKPDVPPDDLRAWAYADLLRWQGDRQDARMLIALLMTLPPDRRMRFEQIIAGRLGGRLEATSQPPREWAGWIALPAVDQQRRLRDQFAVLWGNHDTLPAVRFWRARNDGLATLALMVGEVLGLDDPSPILAALLVQVPALRGDETDPTLPLPPPTTMKDSLRAQIERLPLAPNAQTYAAWCLLVLACDADVGADLIALYPDVAIALAPVLTTEQRAMVIASPAAQGGDTMTHLRWVVVCAPAQEQSMPPIQRSIP